MKIKISKNLQWIIPYLIEVDDLVDLTKIKKIKGFRVQPNLNEQTDGQIAQYSIKNNIITIKTHFQVFKSSPSYKSFQKYQRQYLSPFLDTLAHELAHLNEWHHSTKHLALQLKIMNRFVKVMKKQKIKDTWDTIPKG